MDDSETERTAIRKELSEMSFGDLMKLKDELGTKVYDEAMFGTSSKKSSQPKSFKRVNKNRPREMSSKIPVSAGLSTLPSLPKKTRQTRDPRFDGLCGTFDPKVFRKAYRFVDDIRGQELETLREELKNETDSKRKADIAYIVQRMENQARERHRREEKERQQKEERQEHINALRSGQKIHFPTKAERRAKELVSRYEELKKSGKLQKHLEKQRKKTVHKERKKLPMLG
ncbi:hypothetical protein B566_EDAN001667 [Ephemera danica]|nr:hypothetical protein B566_EDAN001667 [Ephemera danica]